MNEYSEEGRVCQLLRISGLSCLHQGHVALPGAILDCLNLEILSAPQLYKISYHALNSSQQIT
jgi:hypothetical protein